MIFRRLIQLGKLEKGRKKTACSFQNRLLLHPPRTCYWHRVASKEAKRGLAPVSDKRKKYFLGELHLTAFMVQCKRLFVKSEFSVAKLGGHGTR